MQLRTQTKPKLPSINPIQPHPNTQFEKMHTLSLQENGININKETENFLINRDKITKFHIPSKEKLPSFKDFCEIEIPRCLKPFHDEKGQRPKGGTSVLTAKVEFFGHETEKVDR